MLKNIICDLCGPLIKIDVRLIDVTFYKFGVVRPNPYYELCRLGIVAQADSGDLQPAEFCERVRQVLDAPLTDYQIETAWNSLTTSVCRRHLQFMERMRLKGYNTFILSNSDLINAPYFNQYIEKEMGEGFLGRAFNHVYYSSDDNLRMRKPSPEIFLKVLELNGLRADETIFADDTLVHCQGAAAAGLRTLFVK